MKKLVGSGLRAGKLTSVLNKLMQEAASKQDYELMAKDMSIHGFALSKNGKRVNPKDFVKRNENE